MGSNELSYEAVNQYRSNQWSNRGHEENTRTENEQPDFWFSGVETGNCGLSSYRSVKDIDRVSSGSGDDTSSISESNSDSVSVDSLPSSQTSVTDPSDLLSDDDISDTKYVFQNSSTVQEVQSKILEQAALLSGLGARPLTQQNIDSFQRVDSWRKEQNSGLDRPTTVQESDNGLPLSIEVSTTGITNKCNRRRFCPQATRLVPPCKLKRDTESSDCFVTLLIIFATRLITAIWPLSASPPMMSSCFNGAGVLPLRVFIQETLRRSKTSYSTLQVALYYLVLLKGKLADCDFTKEQSSSGTKPGCRAMQCGRRMFLAALMLASKYLQDRNYSTRAWSKISGLRSNEINENEAEYLKTIDYSLHIPKEAFENWSKIVLTLSKLSKLQPGSCARRLQNLTSPSSGSNPLLSNMVIDQDEHHPFTQDQEIFSNQWWADVIKQLEPQMVKSSQQTDAFIHEHVPLAEVSELLSRVDHSLQTGPGSPESPTSYNPDMTFSEALQARGMNRPTTTTPLTPAASPRGPLVLPLRPQPRNLPTPQSTPGATEAYPWIQHSATANQSLRCSASMDALRSIRKQCFVNANLERCPPPAQRPTSLVLPTTSNPMRPAESNQNYSSRYANNTGLSPASSISSEYNYQPTMRSRSSSISSSESWSSVPVGQSRTLPLSATSSSCSSPLAKFGSTSEQPSTLKLKRPGLDQGSRLVRNNSAPLRVPGIRLEGKRGASHLAPSLPSSKGFHDEGYASGEDALSRMSSQLDNLTNEYDAIRALLTLSSTKDSLLAYKSLLSTQEAQFQQDQNTTISPRGHKRSLSRTNDSLQNCVSDLLRSESTTDEAIEDPLPSSHESTLEKQWQTPTKAWAAAKKPVSGSSENKRIAVHCATQQISSAPDIASRYLKDTMLTV